MRNRYLGGLILLPGIFLLFHLLATDARAVIRDGGIDPANLGKGDWIYFMSAATNKLGKNISSVTNENSLMLWYKSQGIRYIIIKAATSATLFNGSYSGPQFTSNLVNFAHANGILIFGYNRSYGQDVPAEIAISDYVFHQGADGFVWDAESEWESSQTWITTNGPSKAWTLCSAVRSNWPNKFLAHAPFPIISYHSSFPYKEFGYWCDTVMPQIYPAGWTGVKSRPSGGINWTDVNWFDWQNSLYSLAPTNINGITVYWTNAIKPLVPINHVYGPNPPNTGVSHIPDEFVMEFVDYLVADPHFQTAGGCKGANFWRTDLHGAVQWANIMASTVGDFPGIVNNIVIDDPTATTVGNWTSTRVFYNGSYYGATGTDTNSFGTNYLTRAQGSGTNYVEFTPTVIAPGDYDVYQWHPYLINASTGTPHVVIFNGGTNIVFANQTTNHGKWSLLGRFNFTYGVAGKIRVLDSVPEPGKVAVADGIKLVYVPPTNAPPEILIHPQNVTATNGQSATFNFTVIGTPPFAYQWQLNATPIPGATDASLVFGSVQLSNGGDYSVVVTNSFGSTTSLTASLTVILPFLISDVTTMPRPSSALITWNTSSNSTAQVEYGLTTNHEFASPIDPTLKTNHSRLLVGLLPKTNYFFRVVSRIDTNEFRSGEFTFSTDLDFIVDNPQAYYSGTWTLGSSSPDKYGAYYQTAVSVTGPTPTSQATYRPTLPVAGKYDVSIWYPAGFNRTTNAAVTVFFNESLLARGVDQTINGGAWQLLWPALNFSAGTEGFATLGNNTGESGKILVADAMRWSYLASQDLPTDGSPPTWWSSYYFGADVDASLDPDGDGSSTYAEYIAGTDPTDPNSRLQMNVTANGSNVQITFNPCQGGRVYQLTLSTNLNNGNWALLPDLPTVNGSNGNFILTNTSVPETRFYRLGVHLTP